MDRIGVIFGGKSTEHAISLLSASAVISELDLSKHSLVCIGITEEGEWKLFEGDLELIQNGNWEAVSKPIAADEIKDLIDFALPILHGSYGEDGTIQGLFEMLDIPYAGCGVLGSSLPMDKIAAKMVFEAAGIPTCPYVPVLTIEMKKDPEGVIARCEGKLRYPMFVKPANAGSSVGISKVRNAEELAAGLAEAARYDRRIIVEEGVDAREIECGVIGNDEPEATGVGEIVAKNDFYDYKAKYSDDAGTEIMIPAKGVSPELLEELRRIAVETYMALDCAGFARVDFLVEKNTGRPFVNEVNTIPGFTKYSMFPYLWKERGVSFSELIERIIGYGYERYNYKNNRQTIHR